jgi:hypothetical protein
VDSIDQQRDSQDSATTEADVLSAAAVRANCAERLRRMGIRPGISKRKLKALLQRQEGRRIDVIHRGVDGHLYGTPAGYSARLDRRAKARRITVWVADPRRSARGQHCLLHELAHLIVQPGSGEPMVSIMRPPGDSIGAPRFDCGCGEAVEREAEATAGLLGEFLVGPLTPTTVTVTSGSGLVLARHGGGTHDVL